MDYEALSRAEGAEGGSAMALSSMESDAIGEILNISMGAGATAVSTLIGRPVDITIPNVSIVRTEDFEIKSLEPAVGIEIEYIAGLNGSNLLIMKSRDIKAIVNLLLMSEGEPEDEDLNEMHYSAIGEIMNQMMGASATALSSLLGSNINISTPNQFDIGKLKDKINESKVQERIVVVRFLLHISDLLDSEFITVMPIPFTKELVSRVMNMGEDEPEGPPKPAPDPVREPTPPPKPEKPPVQSPPPPKEKVTVQPLKLKTFDEPESAEPANIDNFDLVLDVPLELSVEIGRTKMEVKNILELRQGSIVELDKQAGDPVDIYVNGLIIARGDVVIINDDFGVRITEIVPGNRLPKSLS